jgi:hypothetical protein
VTDKGIADLRKALPNLKISWTADSARADEAEDKAARRRLRKLIWDYPGIVAALQAHIILGTLED